MIELFAPVFAASVVGSLHCAGMCGGLVAFACGEQAPGARRHVAAQAAYHAARLVSYLALGVIAGTVGGAIDRVAYRTGMANLGALLAAITMITWGLAALFDAGRTRGRRSPGPIRRWVVAHLASLRHRPPIVRATLMGLGTALLPCGWLYAFVVAGAGTGSAATSAAVMAAFWLGTVPALLGVGAAAQWFARRLRGHAPTLSAVALIAVGLASLLGRYNVPVLTVESALGSPAGPRVPTGAPCHGD